MTSIKLKECFYLDITITDSCNFRCDYCFETDYFAKKKYGEEDLLLLKTRELLESEWFNKEHGFLQINFWGGEPTLNMPFVKKIFDTFKGDENVRFFMYTNGHDVKGLIPLHEEVKGQMVANFPKFLTQISYDGEPINSLMRRGGDGKSTSEKVRANFKELTRLEYPVTLKSTISSSMFKHLYEAYLDYTDLTGGSIDFHPTIDYHNSEDDEATVKGYLEDLKANLLLIAKKEKEVIKRTGRSGFSWFNNSRSLCSAGANMVCADTSGELFKCHGCSYEGECKPLHKVTSFKQENWIESLAVSSAKHYEHLYDEPEMCKECPATYCIRCNSAKFSLSKKEDYFDRWTDYGNQDALCSFYQLNGKIVRALNYTLRNEE